MKQESRRIRVAKGVSLAVKHSTAAFTLVAVGAAAPGVASANTPASASSMFYNPDTIAAGTPCHYGVNQFQSAVVNWRNEMDDHVGLGPHDNTVFYEEVTDWSKDNINGRDSIDSNVDAFDISILATHGGPWWNSGTQQYDNLVLQLTGQQLDPNADCLSGQHGEWVVGNNQSEYLDLFACNSLEFINNGFINGYTSGLHQLHGYSGTMATGTGTSDKLNDYLDDAYAGAAAWAWVFEETSYNHWGDGWDVCAVVATFGNSWSDSSSRVDLETYSGGTYSDPVADYTMYAFLSDCEPHSAISGPMGTW